MSETKNALVIPDATVGWTKTTGTLLPGAYVAVLMATTTEGKDAIVREGRARGLELRDTFIIYRKDVQQTLGYLFRRPIEASTIAHQVLETGTGAINIEATRILPEAGGVGRWPTNLLLVHGTCTAEECGSDCPIQKLDEMSGERGGGFGKQYARHEGASWSTDPRDGAGSGFVNDGRSFGYGDSGGPSRFHARFREEGELIAWLTLLVTPPS